jgi:uncharacterized membrane protein YqjE
MNNLAISLLSLLLIVVLAIYWTVWKCRADLNQNLEKVISELSETRKALEKKGGGA